MKVLTINGSPHLHVCTDRALLEFEKTLAEYGIEIERINVGNKDIGAVLPATIVTSMANVRSTTL